MCGIVAYSGKHDQVLPTLMDGLKRLEYRGYDSAGVAILTDHGIYVQKNAGKVSVLEAAIQTNGPNNIGQVGIAHTRWATHGQATAKNAHPHGSADGKIWVVHNGIIENYRSIKERLINQGITFQSDTDSEVIAKLIGFLYKGDLRQAILDSIKQLQGAYALCVLSSDEPKRLIGVKMSSSLVVGLGDGEFIIASDIGAIINQTKQVIYLRDGELVDILDGTYSIFNFNGDQQIEKIDKIDWSIEAPTKAGFDHYLFKEILEQPAAIRDTIRGRIITDQSLIKLGGFIDVKDRLACINRVLLLGIGTSYYAAKLGELYFNALSGVPAIAVMSPEFRYSQYPVDEKTWMIAISQSGETADTIAAIHKANQHHALVTGIVNVVGSTITRITKAGVYNHIGPEISVASTKAFTSQSVLLLMHALLVGGQYSQSSPQILEILGAIERLPDCIENVLEKRAEIERIAQSFKDVRNLLYIGREYNYPIALEGALKIKEIAYIHAEGLSGGELKHGFIALIDEQMQTIAMATNDAVKDKMLANIAEIKARNGKVICIAHEPHEAVDETIIVPDIGSVFLQPLINNVVLQLLAYYAAKLRGCDIDQPRNLAKSVTVE